MPRYSPTSEHDTAFTAQAIIELTEANVSSNGHGDEWQREVAFLHDPPDETAPGSRPDDFDEMIELATALA